MPEKCHFYTYPSTPRTLLTTSYTHRHLLPDGNWKVFAPWGLTDILSMVVRPNPVSGNMEAYEKKTERWKRIWPGLIVIPWPHDLANIIEQERLDQGPSIDSSK